MTPLAFQGVRPFQTSMTMKGLDLWARLAIIAKPCVKQAIRRLRSAVGGRRPS
jgi:hypothetical protein